MPTYLLILLLMLWSWTNILATESIEIKDISSYEEVEFTSPVVTRQMFEKPTCGEMCEKKMLLGIGFIHRYELIRESSSNVSYLVNSELAGTNVWFPYFVERKILNDKDFMDVTPYTLASRIKKELSDKTSAIVIYDGNGVDRFGKYPDGGIYLPEARPCQSIRKKLGKVRLDYLRASTEMSRSKALRDYQELYNEYRTNVCYDRVLEYKDLISSLSGPDLFFIESSQKLNGRNLKNKEHGLFDYFGKGSINEIEIFSANITSAPEKVHYLAGESSYYRAFEIIKNSTRNLDKDYNCQITMNEVFDELNTVNITSGVKGDLKPIYDWQTQREQIKKSTTDFVSNPGAYSQSYKSTSNSSGFAVIVNNKNCKNIQSELVPLTKQLLSDSPSHRITEGTLSRVPKLLSVKETELQISMDMNFLSAQLSDNLVGKFLYTKAGTVDYLKSAQAGAAADLTESGLKTADMVAHPSETIEGAKKSAKQVNDYFHDENGVRLSGDEAATKLMKDGKMLVKEGQEFVLKDCAENLCRESLKTTMKFTTEIALGAGGGIGVSSLATKTGSKILKSSSELLEDTTKMAKTTDSVLPDSELSPSKIDTTKLDVSEVDDAGFEALQDAGFENYKKPASSSPNTLSSKVEKVTTVKSLADGIGESDIASMQGTHDWWNDLNKQAQSSDPAIASQATKKIELSHQIMKEQMDTGLPYTALTPEGVAQIQKTGYVPKNTFFSNPETGPHVGHGGKTAYIRCKTPSCTAEYFPNKKSSTGSGIQNEYEIPSQDLEFVYVDHNKIENTIKGNNRLSDLKISNKVIGGKGKMTLIENVKGVDAINGIAIRYKNSGTGVMEEGFVFGDKVGSHRNLLDQAKVKYGDDAEILWLGEAKVSNGKITQMNETAGTLKEDSVLKNKVEGISAAQRISKNQKLQYLFHEETTFDKYQEGGNSQHVIDGLSGASYMRHDAHNKISVFMLSTANRLEKGQPVSIERMNMIRNDASEVLKNFKEFRKIPNNGLTDVESGEFQSILQEIVSGDDIKAWKLKRLHLIYNKIEKRVNSPNVEMTSEINK